jgi:tetratricopeptide (TPR) repeat protein
MTRLPVLLLPLLLTAPMWAQEVPLFDGPTSPKAKQSTRQEPDDDLRVNKSPEASRLARESIEAFRKGDYARSEELLRRQLELQPDNFVVYYNLACCRVLLNDTEQGLEFLTKAIEHGFCDIRQLRNDPSLRALHEHQSFKRILERWDDILIARRDANLKASEELFKKGYVNALDERLRLAYRSAFDEVSFQAAKDELTKLAEWGDANVIEGLLDPARSAEDAWVVVVLPTRPDFMRWVVSLYGPAAASTTSMIAGSYEHDAKRLVAMDLGSTLRHEFFHVLHWRDMTRRGQMHPIWIMEGLCSLVEDYDLDATGNLIPAASWRTNTVKRLEKLNRLTPIETLAAMPQHKFSGERPLAHYAQARAIFLYLYSTGKLKDWYREYTSTYRDDPAGIKAMETVFDRTIKDINRDYKAWVRALPEVPEQIARGMASLGIEIDAGKGEGPIVASLPRGRRDLLVGDIITSIDNRPTRDIAELIRVLGSCKPGQVVEVGYRRGKTYGSVMIELVAKQ